MNITRQTKQTIQRYKLLKHGDKLLLGVSGGADSVCLLHALNQCKHELGISLHVAHVNHKLRKTADTDERFVKKLVERLNLPFSNIKLDHLKKRRKGSLEEIAREERLKRLIELAKRIDANSIALAHHQDDLAETVLMRILRGSGLLGLAGILPKRTLHGAVIIRPFIELSKSDILAFLKKNKIPFRTDPTNRQTKFFRNKIRLKLLPLLKKEYNNNIQQALAQLSNTSFNDYQYIEQQAGKQVKKLLQKTNSKTSLKLRLPIFCRLQTSLKRMVIRLCLSQLKGDTKGIVAAHLKEIEDLIENRPEGSVVHLPYKISIQKSPNHLIFKCLRNT